MKKVILAVIALVVIGATSCKKDATATPELKKEKVTATGDKRDNGSYDGE